MKFAIYKTKIGYIRIGYDKEKLLSIEMLDKCDYSSKRSEFSDEVFKQIKEYLDGNRKEFNFDIVLEGTDFQKMVWNELLKIPYGETVTYKYIAKKIGNEKSYRAVGNANNKNKIPIVVPCHRVIGTNGNLIGYVGGLYKKEFLINLEKENK